jgi:asparagine synthase (glutamine-hydrolysing)
MCGINGILEFGGGVATPSLDLQRSVESMNQAILHRGPDGEGVFAAEGVALGHRRLSILDLTEAGSQPMFNDDKSVVIVFNGEIYNYLELIPELLSRGHRFRSRSDTEVIIRAYEEYGPRCVERFNGMWAFALYDIRRKRLFASRDRLGVKPFYFLRDAHRFIFSSEIKAILKVENAAHVNSGKVFDYVAYGYKTANGDTFFNSISELNPGTNLIIENGLVATERYWHLPQSPGVSSDAPDMEKLSSEFSEILESSIGIRFRSDVPVAILLSGGLDSTAITRTVDEMIGKGRLGYTNVQAFTAGFPGDKNDETDLVREFIGTCRHVQLQHVYPSGSELPSLMEQIAYGFGEPVASATSFAHYSLMKEIRSRDFKVVINGQGADESFCGYDRYFMGYFLIDILRSAPQKFPAQTKALNSIRGYSYAFILSQMVKAALPRRLASYLRGRFQEGVIDCLHSDFVSQNYKYFDNQPLALLSGQSLDRYLRGNLQQYGFNQILHYEDHSSMQHSVEIRSPFIDYRLIEMAFRSPARAKYDMGVTKKVIRHAFQNRLPSNIVNSPRKIGFATPFGKWLADKKLREFAFDVLNSTEFGARGIWNADKIRAAFSAPDKHAAFPFWRILNLELWARAYRVTGL